MGNLKKLQLRLSKDDDDLGETHFDSGVLLEEERPQLKPPPMYRVVLFNDDYTPMDFVVEILEVFFAMDREKATRVMLSLIHI